jgi:hypothetical protein
LVELRDTPPKAGVTLRGTVVFGTGADGTGWYDGDPTAVSMMTALTAKGFRVVQRRWQTSWEAGPGGMGAVSARYAALLGWIHQNAQTGGALCATGNSGGASEISYALTRWDAEAILDLAIPTSGPPMARMDLGCFGSTNATWQNQCNSSYPKASWECTPLACTYQGAIGLIEAAYAPSTPCADAATPATSAMLLADSVLAPNAVLGYPRTFTHFIFGKADCSEAVPLGITYAQAVTSAKKVEFVAATPHKVTSTSAGAGAIFAALDTNCVLRH